ncbi:MAG TPA: AlpA family phage regulatory protein [Alphaproteobacteria bacterium]|nr:AlpA family phage regulatory protein [Alphaproteobacteria bacterium]
MIKGYRALQEYTGRSRVQLWRDIRADRFPAPIELGANSVAWFRDEVDEHLRNRPRRSYHTPEPQAAA